MIISPPFLPARAAGTSDEQYIDTAMHGGTPGEGGYPISFRMCWHGGIHMASSEPVRAIADGEVVFLRKAKKYDSDPSSTDPLNYGGWTSDGCVIIKHTTDIGEGAQATEVVFYSLYMHLENIEAAVEAAFKNKKKLWRKDKLGTSGYISGQTNKLHFEIFCDADNLTKLVGRSTGDVNVASHGRADVVYGQLYFHLPAGTQFYAQQPTDHLVAASTQPPKPAPTATNKHPAWPAPVALTGTATTEALIIGLRYGGGEVLTGGTGRGDALLTTTKEDGTPVGAMAIEADAEYNLYSRATALSKAYSDHGLTVVPAPSAVYELLRFGRVINTAHETLTPNDVPHWRKVKVSATQEGWVNLNATNVHKTSDADFPQWQGWQLIVDDDDNSRCDAQDIIKLITDTDKSGKISKGEAQTALQDQGSAMTPQQAQQLAAAAKVQAKLKKTICKFVSEWSKADILAKRPCRPCSIVCS